jgi:hypothetical protein
MFATTPFRTDAHGEPWLDKAALAPCLRCSPRTSPALRALIAAVALFAALAHGARMHLWHWCTGGTPS